MAESHTMEERGGGGGRCNVVCVTKRGITEEHALSGTRYQ